MNVSPVVLRIGTRGSPLALAQAHEVRSRLQTAHPELRANDAIAIEIIRTTGDQVTDRPLAAIGGKGLFTKEIEQALDGGRIDLAVHSMKDVPTWLPDGLIIDCILPREDPRDAFFSRTGLGLLDLPAGAVIGTASLRRQAQILRLRPDLTVVPLRGNVDTRLQRLDEGVVDATLLAMAGLNRLGHRRAPTTVLDPSSMLPAVAQGAVGIERRQSDDRVRDYLAPLHDLISERRVAAERALLRVLDGSCRTPIAALATLDDDRLTLTGMVIRPNGKDGRETRRVGRMEDAERMGEEAGAELKSLSGPGYFIEPGMQGTQA